MATIEHWQKYMNLLHEHALVEDDLRKAQQDGGTGDYFQDYQLAVRILFERFGVDL